ncbi:MAG: GGDEF domain-containing protein [Firmicutes bacterium]|nr:GGDEF domain-containing protein [Bacillota bacterium]
MEVVRNIMNTSLVTVDSFSSLERAGGLMNQQLVGSVLVVDEGELVGIVTSRDIRNHHHNRLVCDVMTREVKSIPASADIIEAIEVMQALGVERLPVIDDGKLVGIITMKDLLRHYGILNDPLTGLPWGTLLRVMAARLLDQGKEIVILFADLDDFGKVNKQYGHVWGDKALVGVARLIKQLSEKNIDLACRYAGDEFIILSERDLSGAEKLAQDIISGIKSIELEFQISLSIGISGGRRRSVREETPTSVVVDDLINLASRASTRAKHKPKKYLIATKSEK